MVFRNETCALNLNIELQTRHVSNLFYYFINSVVDIDNGYWEMKVVEKLFLFNVSDRDIDMFENSGKAHQI